MNKFNKEGWYWIEQKIGGKNTTKIFYFNKDRDYETIDKIPLHYLGKDVDDFFKLYKTKAS